MSTATTARSRAQSAQPAPAEPQEPAKATGNRKKLMAVAVVLVVAAVAAWFFLLRDDGASAAAPEPVPGEVLALDPLSINLADGRYLRVGIALQLVEKPKHALEGSKALDLTISTLSGREVTALTDPKQRDAIKVELEGKIEQAYDEDVMGIYFTEFVTQ